MPTFSSSQINSDEDSKIQNAITWTIHSYERTITREICGKISNVVIIFVTVYLIWTFLIYNDLCRLGFDIIRNIGSSRGDDDYMHYKIYK